MGKTGEKISDQLRKAVEAAGVSRYEISRQTGIHQSVLSRFVRGETGLDLTTVDKLAAYLGMRLVKDGPKGEGR